MACAVCKSVEVKFRCVDCADDLCTAHAAGCAACRKALCPTHAKKTPGGRILCMACMRARNERRAAAKEERAAQAPPPAAGGGGFSFQDLMSDLPPVPSAAGAVAPESPVEPLEGGMGLRYTQGQKPPRDLDDPRDERYLGADGLDDAPDPEIEKKLAQMLGEGEKSVRVLTGSAPKGRPMWMGSAFLGVLTWVVFAFIPNLRPISNYVVIVLSVGTLAWAVSGLRNENDTPQERKLNLIGLILAVAAGATAFFQRGS